MSIFNKNRIKIVEPDPSTFNDIKVVGVGGGGGNTVNHMHSQGVKCVDFAVCNTDSQVLGESPVMQKLQLGPNITRGKGAGSIPEVGIEAAKESIEDIRSLFPDRTEMVFVTAGMGGGTGTGAAPIVAKTALEAGKLTLGIVTTPFSFEGRDEVAEKGLKEMKESVDSLIVIDNDKIFEAYEGVDFGSCFAMVNEVLNDVASNVADIVTRALTVNVDMNDMKTLLKGSRTAMLGAGKASGENKAEEAIRQIFSSPFMSDVNVYDSSGFIFVIKHGKNGFPAKVMKDITSGMRKKVGPKPQCIKWGYGYDPDLEDDEIMVIFITAGFPEGKENTVSDFASRGTVQTKPTDLPINGHTPSPITGHPFRRESRRNAEGKEVEYTIYSLSCFKETDSSSPYMTSLSVNKPAASYHEMRNSPSPIDVPIKEMFARQVMEMHMSSPVKEKGGHTKPTDPAYIRRGLKITINPPSDGRTNTFFLK